MKNQVNESAKIEQLLGELGTISPPFLNNKEQLKRLASELYLLADLLEEAKEQGLPPAEPVSAETQTLHIPNLQPNHTDWSNPIPEMEAELEEELTAPTILIQPEHPAEPTLPPAPPVQTPEVQAPPVTEKLPEHPAEPILPPAPPVQTPEIQAPPVTEKLPEHPTEPVLPPAPVMQTPEIQAPPVTEKLPEHPAEPVLPPAPPAPKVEVPPVHTPPRPQNNARDLHKSLPLVKRIEFINRLFAGKEDEWQHFCRQVNQAPHDDAALNVYREHFIRMSWEKNADSADQLKQVIVKICA
ncbi:MAG: hypothetical protein KJS92_04680 [Bacteroidetes bacterium]|nr:hypothetical protein [Bacteroidota bacterium]